MATVTIPQLVCRPACRRSSSPPSRRTRLQLHRVTTTVRSSTRSARPCRPPGISGEKILGEAGDAAGFTALKAGTELAWTGYSVPFDSWEMMDAAFRNSEGMTVPRLDATQPTQIVTKANAGSIKLYPERSAAGTTRPTASRSSTRSGSSRSSAGTAEQRKPTCPRSRTHPGARGRRAVQELHAHACARGRQPVDRAGRGSRAPGAERLRQVDADQDHLGLPPPDPVARCASAARTCPSSARAVLQTRVPRRAAGPGADLNLSVLDNMALSAAAIPRSPGRSCPGRARAWRGSGPPASSTSTSTRVTPVADAERIAAYGGRSGPRAARGPAVSAPASDPRRADGDAARQRGRFATRRWSSRWPRPASASST